MSRYGLHGQFLTQPGKADELAAHLLEAASGLEANLDCELYVIHRSPDVPDVVWVTEVWKSREAHAASLEVPGVQELIQKARPLIAGMGERTEFLTLGGKGLQA